MSLGSLESVSLPIDFSEFDEIIDVRSPGEFAEDHLPGACNLPVLSDEQRAEVGTLYTENQHQGRRLGASYISEALAGYLAHELADRPYRWKPLLYCWRGGLRSGSFATVLRSVGWRARVLSGGYKAWRNHVIQGLEDFFNGGAFDFRVLAGLTGTGKTRLLHALRDHQAQIVDLEGLANHKGSLLGSCGDQPSQKRFETMLFNALQELDSSQPVFCEAESNRIGSVNLPAPLWKTLPTSRVLEVKLSFEERVRLLLEDYEHFLEDPGQLRSALDRLRRLRGHETVDTWHRLIEEGAWPEFVSAVLKDHYDLCYRRPGSDSSVYQSPARNIALPDASHESYSSAAQQLLHDEKEIPRS